MPQMLFSGKGWAYETLEFAGGISAAGSRYANLGVSSRSFGFAQDVCPRLHGGKQDFARMLGGLSSRAPHVHLPPRSASFRNLFDSQTFGRLPLRGGFAGYCFSQQLQGVSGDLAGNTIPAF